MDKLKENAFALSLAGLGILILALGFFLIYQPLSALGNQDRQMSRLTRDLKNYLEDEEENGTPVPSADVKEYWERLLAAEKDELAEGLQFIEQRLGRFNEYFDGSRQQPDLGVFYSQYEDSIRNLVDKYRESFSIEPGPEDSGENLPPKLDERVQNDTADPAGSAQNIPLAMKEYWIIEAVFETCQSLGLGGLQAISMPQRVDDRQRGSARRRDEEGPKGYFVTSPLEATVRIHMPFSQFEEFLSMLYNHPRVPIVGVSSMRYNKIEASLQDYQPLVLEYDIPQESGDGAATSLPPEAQKKKQLFEKEPPVSFEITLQAVRWGGLRPPQEVPES